METSFAYLDQVNASERRRSLPHRQLVILTDDGNNRQQGWAGSSFSLGALRCICREVTFSLIGLATDLGPQGSPVGTSTQMTCPMVPTAQLAMGDTRLAMRACWAHRGC